MKIFLTGMPGCGKSTLGRALSENLGLSFIDLDKKIERDLNKTIPDIFKEYGEKTFREEETNALKSVIAVSSSCIVATGGGILTRQENINILKNEIVIFIDRPTEMIASNVSSGKRPLLMGDTKKRLNTLFNERYDTYKSCCTVHFKNDQDKNTAVFKLTEIINQIINNRQGEF